MLKSIGLASVAALLAVGGYIAFTQYQGSSSQADTAAVPVINWVAAAPGRVEPKSGEIRIGSSLLGRIAEVLVKADDKVEEGDLLIRLDDAEARAKLGAAETQAEALREEREKQFVSGREDVRKAEDAIYSAERAATGARIEFDFALSEKRAGKSGADQPLADARKRLKDANARLERERLAFVKAQSKSNLPAPNSAESAVSAARTEVRMAEALLDKSRIRSPISGTVLQVNAKDGEVVSPSPEPLIVVGDMSLVRVKAEVDEHDVAKIKVGQKAFVRSVGFPGKEFEGTVSSTASSLGSAKIGPRGPRRANDVEVLEVTIDLEKGVPLLPGMRVDAFFRKD
jgi:HlyD family secretion protein